MAVLIGQGSTNRRIAEELAITERTAETHVSRILRKLGLRSRTQIAAWTIEQGLESRVENRESGVVFSRLTTHDPRDFRKIFSRNWPKLRVST